jgi:hypothetical protein
MKNGDLPYEECKDCKTLGDCPHPDIEMNNMGTPMPPDCCPNPIKVMNATLKKRKLKNSKYGIN